MLLEDTKIDAFMQRGLNSLVLSDLCNSDKSYTLHTVFPHIVSAETILFEFAIFQFFTEFLLFKSGKYMGKYDSLDAQHEIQILN